MLVHLERDELKTIVMIGRKMQNLLDDVKHVLDEEVAGDFWWVFKLRLGDQEEVARLRPKREPAQTSFKTSASQTHSKSHFLDALASLDFKLSVLQY